MPRYDNVTFLLCMPRSRSAWLTEFLKPAGTSWHDPLKTCESIDELQWKIDRALVFRGNRPVFVGDTGAVLFHADLLNRFRDARFLYVERSAGDVLKSLTAQGKTPMPGFFEAYGEAMHYAHHHLHRGDSMWMHVAYDRIDRNLRNIWRFIGAPGPLDMGYAEEMRKRKIEIPFDEQEANTDREKVRRLLATIGL